MLFRDYGLECKLLAYGLRSKVYFNKLSPDLFTDAFVKYSYNAVARYLEEHNELPTKEFLKIELSSNGIASAADAKHFIKKLLKYKDDNDFYSLLKKARELREARGWKEKISTGIEYLKKGKLANLRSIFNSVPDTKISTIEPFEIKSLLKTNLENNYISSGFPKLDEVINGFGRTELTVFAAMAKSGKSALMMNCWYNAAMKGFKSLYLSIEMDRLYMEKRLLSLMTETKFKDIIHANTDEEKLVIYKKLAEQHSLKVSKKIKAKYLKYPIIEGLNKLIRKLPVSKNLFLWCLPPFKIADILPEVSALQPDIIFIDYLNWVEPSKEYKEEKSWQRLGQVAADMKALAKKLNCAVVTAVQITDDKKKVKYSRMISEHADLVIKWEPTEVEDDSIIRTFKLESMFARNCPQFSDLYLIANFYTMKLQISSNLPYEK